MALFSQKTSALQWLCFYFDSHIFKHTAFSSHMFLTYIPSKKAIYYIRRWAVTADMKSWEL